MLQTVLFLYNSSTFSTYYPQKTQYQKRFRPIHEQEERTDMKATGIVRRIDDLGRVVIPKEIRRTLKIRESEPLEIFTDRNGEIILKKYSPIGEITTSAQQLAEAASKTCGKLFCICDQDQVIAASGPESKKYQGKQLSKDMEKRLFDRDFFPEGSAYYPVTEDDTHTEQIIVPVISSGDSIGAVCFLSTKRTSSLGEAEQKVADMVAHYLALTMEP